MLDIPTKLKHRDTNYQKKRSRRLKIDGNGRKKSLRSTLNASERSFEDTSRSITYLRSSYMDDVINDAPAEREYEEEKKVARKK